MIDETTDFLIFVKEKKYDGVSRYFGLIEEYLKFPEKENSYEIYQFDLKKIPLELLHYVFYDSRDGGEDYFNLQSLAIARQYLTLVDHGPKDEENYRLWMRYSVFVWDFDGALVNVLENTSKDALNTVEFSELPESVQSKLKGIRISSQWRFVQINKQGFWIDGVKQNEH